SEEHRRKAVRRELSCFDEGFERAEVVALRRVIRHLAVVRIRASLEEQARQLLMVSDARRAVQRALELRLWLVIHFKEPGVRARAGVEQRPRGSHEASRSRAIEPEVSREAQMGERVPPAR